MKIHLFLFAYITLMGCIVYRHKPYTRKKNKTFLILSFSAVGFLFAFRSLNVGWDTVRYIDVWNWICAGVSIRRIRYELFFKLLMLVCSTFSHNYTFFLTVTAFILVYGIGNFLLNNLNEGESAFLPVILYLSFCLYFNSYNLMRQYIALSVVSSAYTVLNKKERRPRDYILAGIILIISFFFHKSSIIAILYFFPFLMPKMKKREILLIIFAAVAGSLLISRVTQFLYLLFPEYVEYETSEKITGADSLGGQYTIMFLYQAVLVTVVFVMCAKESNQELYRLGVLTTIGAAFMAMRVVVQLSLRFSYYFLLFPFILTPKILNRFTSPNTRILFKGAIYLMAVGLFVIALRSSNGHRGSIPFQFVWQ